MPDQIGDVVIADAPVMRDTGDAAQRVVGFRASGIYLADDGVFGAGDAAQRSHRRPDTITAAVVDDGLERSRRVGQSQFGCIGE
jgi:hypothetical protein